MHSKTDLGRKQSRYYNSIYLKEIKKNVNKIQTKLELGTSLPSVRCVTI
jgi:hypothetical protein